MGMINRRESIKGISAAALSGIPSHCCLRGGKTETRKRIPAQLRAVIGTLRRHEAGDGASGSSEVRGHRSGYLGETSRDSARGSR